jgi:opacity protein-like surface antigen
VTGLDVNVNFHYVFNFSKDGQGFSVYPLAGIGMQNNFYGKQKVEVDGVTTELDRSNTTKFAFNLGGGITLPLSERSYLNAEAKFMFANDDNVVIMLGYGYKF